MFTYSLLINVIEQDMVAGGAAHPSIATDIVACLRLQIPNTQQFKVDGLEIGEGWLSHTSRNVVEYRQKVHSAMQMAQTRYLERKGEKKVHNQRENVIQLREKDDFLTVNPKLPSMALQKRKLYKEGRGAFSRVLERYFVIDNMLITFFEKETSTDFMKNAKLEGAYVFVESRSDFSDQNTVWHESQSAHRVQIGLLQRQQHPVYFYTNDLNEAKTLAARVQLSSTTKKGVISDLIRKLSLIEIIFRFQQVWDKIFQVYEKRLLKMISFQILGINLNELATTAWLQREKLFRFWSGQVLKREKIPFLRSTFRYGQIKRQLDPSLYKSSLIVREGLLKLVRAFKNRRLQRHSAIQKDIQVLLEEEESGSQVNSLKISTHKQAQSVTFKLGNIKVEENRYLTFQRENETERVNAIEFLESNPPLKFALEDISCLATDYRMFDKQQSIFTVRVYGKNIKEFKPDSVICTTNLTPDELGLDILRNIPEQGHVYQVKINSIELSISVAKRFSLKADLRVKLRQARVPEMLDQSYYVNSRPFRINVPPERDRGRMVIKGQDYTFVVDPINQHNLEETFKLSLVLQRNNVPVTQFMKEFLFEEEFTSDKTFKYEAAQDLEVKCSDSQGNKMKVKFSVTRVPIAGQQVFEREGLRLLVGRYVIYQKRIALLKAINRDNTVDLQNLVTGSIKQGVKMKNIKMIEHSGVNVYDLDALPEAVAQSEHQWVLEFRTQSKRLINTITSGIQYRHTAISFAQRAYNRDKKRDIEGRIILSVLEVLDMKPTPSPPFLRISVRGLYEQQQFVFETPPLLNGELSWAQPDANPNGIQFDLGNFFKEEVYTIKFELLYKAPISLTQQLFNETDIQTERIQQVKDMKSQDRIIGSLEMKTTDFIDIVQFGQERCLILSGKEEPYTLLIIQTLFVPSNVTRVEYQLLEDTSQCLSPEHFFHFNYLQLQRHLDDLGFSIPLPKFQPNHFALTQDSQPRISSLAGAKSSKEEHLSLLLAQANPKRPSFEESVLIFRQLWRYRTERVRQRALNEIHQGYWDIFLGQMRVFAVDNSFGLEITDDLFSQDGEVNILDFVNKNAVAAMQAPQDDLFGWIKQRALGEQQAQVQVQNINEVKIFPLMFDGIWKNEESQQYADTYYLIQQGIPPENSELRLKVWRDLLKVELCEFQELRILKKKHASAYTPRLSVYQNYRDMIAAKQDCLAFKQIDEDIGSYRFPKEYLYQVKGAEGLILSEKRSMRSILRVLVIWSRNKKIDEKPVNFGYSKGLMNIIQRMLTLFKDEEACFWVINGLIRMRPMLFSTDTSCLTGGRNSVMRYEMTVFKAILRENLPDICDKLRLLGISVDYLIYDSLSSFYAHYFSSEVVLRLWDLIIFFISNPDRSLKKRALWYLMAPAYWILKERKIEILKATSLQEVYDLYQNGSALTYSPAWIVNDLRDLIISIFVTVKVVKPAQGGGVFSKLLTGASTPAEPDVNERAIQLEETRKRYEGDITLIFNQIELENKSIAQLLNVEKKSSKVSIPNLDYERWRSHVMNRFKKVAIKKDIERVVDDMYKYEEALIDKSNLDLAKINVYIHQLQHMTGVKSFRIKLNYGRVAEDGSFQTVEERYDDEEVFFKNSANMCIINKFYDLEYMAGYNHLKLEVNDLELESLKVPTTCDLLIDIRNLSPNRFFKSYFQLRNEHLIGNSDSFKQPFTICLASFFLQTHTLQQHQALVQTKQTALSHFIESIRRKLPDRIDIFNKQNETEFVAHMQSDFHRIVQGEFSALSNFLPAEIARNTINDMFNYMPEEDGGSYGNISLANLQYLVKQCFFSEWQAQMEGIYRVCSGQNTQGAKDPLRKEEDDENLSEEIMLEKDKKYKQVNNLTSKSDTQKSSIPFSLRNFLVSLVLLSHSTLKEKFDILYDLMDWNDGVADGLDLSSLYLLIKTIFERNLYYWPSHELFNLVENCFDTSPSAIYQAFWTTQKDFQKLKFLPKLKDILTDPSLLQSTNGIPISIDVTQEVQETLNSYQRLFGNKIIDFNHDSSAFKHIGNLIKGGARLMELTQRQQDYRLVIFYQVSSERYKFEVKYDSKGYLERDQDLVEKDDIDEYLKRNINKLYLQGRTKGVFKADFMSQTAQIPFLHDLLRMETLYRDRVQSTLKKKKKLDRELVVLFYTSEQMFVFRFQSRVMQNVEGEVQMLEGNCCRVLMCEAYEEDTANDIRERVALAIEKGFTGRSQEVAEVRAQREVFVKIATGWIRVSEFDRLITLAGDGTSEIIIKLESGKHKNLDEGREEQRDLAGFDCYSLYKHADLTSEWRLCKIMQREPIISVTQNPVSLLQGGAQETKTEHPSQNFSYWIEFLHHRKNGQKLWLRRHREELLMSARYSREQVRNYEQETRKYVRQQYLEVLKIQ